MNCPHPTDRIVRFYSGVDSDAHGRKISDIWGWNLARLESVHDYIQWLFPLREPSYVNSCAPLLTDDCISAFRRDDTLRASLKRSLQLMLKFYGLRLNEPLGGEVAITRAPDFEARSENWLNRSNHNHLRLTRIMTSTRLLGLETCSSALFECLKQIYHDFPSRISSETFRYWRQAASDLNGPSV
jgi:hypothetical protein